MTSTPVERLLTCAKAEVGVEESPRGSNWGKRVAEYLAAVGWTQPAYWCAAFVSWCGAQSVPGWPVPRSADCDVILDWARRRGCLKESPEVGDLFLVCATPKDATHVGIVVAVGDNGTITTIEGNSNNDGSRNGYAVVLRTRALSPRLRFVRWSEAMPSAATLPVYFRGKKLGDAPLREGRAWLPARGLFTALYGTAETASSLKWDGDDHLLTWEGIELPGPVELREGSAWTALRPPLERLGWQVTVQSDRIDLETSEVKHGGLEVKHGAN